MNAASPVSTPPHPQNRRAIAAHFAGRGSPLATASMFAHLPTCGPCKSYFQHHLTIAGLDPRALSAERRIARGLGLRAAPPRPRGWTWLAAALVAPAAAIIFLVIRPPDRNASTAGASQEPFVVRGGGGPAGARPGLWTYRLGPGPTARLVDRVIHRDDDLAFAYSNPGGKRFLMVFGVDEQRRVYWFYPAWPVGAPPPSAVPVAAGAWPHELPEAIRHRLEPGPFRIHALLCDRPLSASTVEADVRRARDPANLPVLDADVVTLTRTFEVEP